MSAKELYLSFIEFFNVVAIINLRQHLLEPFFLEFCVQRNWETAKPILTLILKRRFLFDQLTFRKPRRLFSITLSLLYFRVFIILSLHHFMKCHFFYSKYNILLNFRIFIFQISRATTFHWTQWTRQVCTLLPIKNLRNDYINILGEQHLHIEHNIFKTRMSLDGHPIEGKE